MRKFFMLRCLAIIVLLLGSIALANAQDSTKKTHVIKTNTVSPYPNHHSYINKLVQGIRYKYYPDKTDEQVAAEMYANRGNYYKMLDKIYTDSYKGKGVSRSTFIYQINKKYGDPFPKAAPLAKPTITVQTTPVVNSTPPPDTSANPVAATPAPITDKSLNGQYQYLLSKIYRYQQPLVSAFWKNVTDSLNAERSKLSAAQATLSTQSKTISGLQANTAPQNQVPVSSGPADEISLLGLTLSTGMYSLLMWSLVIGLGVLAAVVIARTGSLKHEATYRTCLYSELEEEFKAYKAKANDKEKKLARELQTERNKVDELMGRG
jgi:hypothetical protein